MDMYAVIGNPIEHSKSPLIHKAFAKQTNQAIQYNRILAPLDGFNASVTDLIRQGYKGVNVTVPFKFNAFQMAQIYSTRAAFAQAANTLIFDSPTHIRADNTDGVGLVRDITLNHKVGIAQKRVLLLGAGGAAEGVAHPIIEQLPAALVIANRTEDKAKAIADKFIQLGFTNVSYARYEHLHGKVFDIVINATSTGLTHTTLPISMDLFADDCLAYDMMYGRETPFMIQAKQAGANVVDGLGMLIEQAAEAFYLWRGVRPDTAPVMDALRQL
jgi:shikimate dehydrogenase